MARPQPIVIVLGSREFTIKPLTMAQVETIEDVMLGAPMHEVRNPATGAMEMQPVRPVRQIMDVILVALKRDDPAETRDTIEGTMPQLATAMAAILVLAGFAVKPMGEAGAAAPNASTGLLSEAG